MTKKIKLISLGIFSLLFCFLSYKLCYFIAEKYFFDKFFYQKSVTYGYWIPGKKLVLKDFGDRAKDLITLQTSDDNKILGANDNKTFKIAIIGDSIVWGQGIKNNERFAVLLEDKLNKVKPTKVYSLGNVGDNIFDNYTKYKKSIDVFGKMDLYIFGLFFNDLAYNNENHWQYNTARTINDLKNNCTNPAFYDTQGDNLQSTIKSLEITSQNYCVFKNLLPLLPKNALYIDLGSYYLDNGWDIQNKFSKIISLNIETAISLPYNQDYRQTRVSPAESHPSIFSNQIFADILFNEITTNPKWNFAK